jgi:hypothetical protein
MWNAKNALSQMSFVERAAIQSHKRLFLSRIICGLFFIQQSLTLLAPVPMATGLRWVHNPYSFFGIENVAVVPQGEVLEFPITVPCSSHGSWADEVDAVDRVAEEVQSLGKDVYQNLETTPKAVEKFFSTEYVPLRDARDISPSSETGLSLESLDVAMLEQSVSTNDDNNVAGADLSSTRDVTTQAASEIVKTRSKKGKKKASSNLGFAASAKNDVKLAADSLSIDKESTLGRDGGKTIEPPLDTHERKNEEAQWYTKGKKGKDLKVSASIVLTDSVGANAPKQTESRSLRQERKNTSQASKKKIAPQVAKINTTPLQSRQGNNGKKSRGKRAENLDGMGEEALDNILSEFKKKHPSCTQKKASEPLVVKPKCSRPDLWMAQEVFKPGMRISNPLLGLSPLLPLPGLLNNLFQIGDDKVATDLLRLANGALYLLNDGPLDFITNLNIVRFVQQIQRVALTGQKALIKVDSSAQLFAMYLVVLNISLLLAQSALEIHGVKCKDVGENPPERLVQNTESRASFAAYANLCPKNTCVDAILASVVGIGKDICDGEGLGFGSRPFECPGGLDFLSVAAKYRGVENLWPVISQDLFLFDAINTYLIYLCVPIGNMAVASVLPTNRMKASFYTAVQCIDLCVTSDISSQKTVFSLLVGELLGHFSGRLALLAYAKAFGVIAQKMEKGSNGRVVCKTSGTEKLANLIQSERQEPQLLLLVATGCLQDHARRGASLLTAREKVCPAHHRVFSKIFPSDLGHDDNNDNLESINLVEVDSFIDFCVRLSCELAALGEDQFRKIYNTQLIEGRAVEKEGGDI